MSLAMILMRLMSLGDISLCVCEKSGCVCVWGVHLMSLGVGLETGLGDEFGDDYEECDEFGGHFFVCVQEKASNLKDNTHVLTGYLFTG
jgi:hypothetical protein